MAESNTAVAPAQPTPQPSPQPTIVSKVSTELWHVYNSSVTTMMAVIYVLIQPYVFFYNLTKSFFENCRDLITIGTLSIRASLLYLQVWIRFLQGMNKDDKPAETVINTVKNIGTATNNIYKRLLNEPGSSSQHSEPGTKSVTFQPIVEVEEYSDSGNESTNGQSSARAGSPPMDANQDRPPHGNGSGNGGRGGNGSSNDGSGGGGGGNGSTIVNGYNKQPAKEAPTSSAAQAGQQGVDEVDKGAKAKPKQTPASAATKV